MGEWLLPDYLRIRNFGFPGLKLKYGIALAACAILAGCAEQRHAAVAPQVSITTEELVGNWGLASYRADTDRQRTQAAARSACSNPYVINRGTSGGVMMYLADQAVPQEVFLKPSADGRVFIGPQGKPGDRADRQIVSYDSGVLVTQWVNPDVARRYGTMILVRCAAKS